MNTARCQVMKLTDKEAGKGSDSSSQTEQKCVKIGGDNVKEMSATLQVKEKDTFSVLFSDVYLLCFN